MGRGGEREEKEREGERGGGGREREGLSQGGSTMSGEEPNMGLKPTNEDIMIQAKRLTDRASQAPHRLCF